EIDVKALFDRASEILEERFPGLLAAIVTEYQKIVACRLRELP
ncbi:unnamed protein product, partial [marine sediment metagenome]